MVTELSLFVFSMLNYLYSHKSRWNKVACWHPATYFVFIGPYSLLRYDLADWLRFCWVFPWPLTLISLLPICLPFFYTLLSTNSNIDTPPWSTLYENGCLWTFMRIKRRPIFATLGPGPSSNFYFWSLLTSFLRLCRLQSSHLHFDSPPRQVCHSAGQSGNIPGHSQEVWVWPPVPPFSTYKGFSDINRN